MYTIAQIKTKRDELLLKRAQFMTKVTPYPKGAVNGLDRSRVLNPSRNFIFMVPELADYLNQSSAICADGLVSKACVQGVVDQFNTITPYWFVSKFDATTNEGVNQPLYDYNSLLQARALTLKQPFDELVKYIDTPAFAKGDLFYIDNLVSTINAQSINPSPSATPSPTPNPLPGDIDGNKRVDIFDYNLLLTDFGATSGTALRSDIDLSGRVDIFDYNLLLTNFGRSIP